LVDDQLSIELPLTSTVAGAALKLTVGAGGVLAFTVTVAERCTEPPPPVHPNVYVLVLFNTAVCSVPEGALLPAHAPLAVHPVALLVDHVSVER
jgi:hypothetical protein